MGYILHSFSCKLMRYQLCTNKFSQILFYFIHYTLWIHRFYKNDLSTITQYLEHVLMCDHALGEHSEEREQKKEELNSIQGNIVTSIDTKYVCILLEKRIQKSGPTKDFFARNAIALHESSISSSCRYSILLRYSTLREFNSRLPSLVTLVVHVLNITTIKPRPLSRVFVVVSLRNILYLRSTVCDYIIHNFCSL
jgi:hypothetical protein